MSDLISRQDAIDAINHICPIDTEYDCALLDRVDVRCVLSELPSAEPERKTGHWIDTDNYYQRWKCSECGCHTRDAEPNYCPHCGTKMEGRANG